VRRADETHEIPGTPVDDATEVAGDTDGPGDRRRLEADLLLDFVEELERVTAWSVVLVEKRDHRKVARPAHLEQLEGL